MKVKLNNILTILSLLVTSLLLIFVVRAWYATNKQANVNEAIGVTAGGKNLYLSTTYNGDSSFLYTESNITDGGWGTQVSLDAANILLPASTSDASNFYYTNDINTQGEAIDDNGVYNFNLVTTSQSYYYVSKKIYLTTLEELDMNCCLRNITIEKGEDTSSKIYEAVRVSFTKGNVTKIFKATSNIVYPAASVTTVASTDPGINQGGQGNTVFSFNLSGATVSGDDKYLNVEEVLVKIWIEGQHPEALATYAGTGFKVNISFQTY